MDTTVLAHVLTDTERDAFERDGYFFVENALTSEQVRHFAAAVDDVDARERRAGRSGTDDRLNLHDVIGNDARFLELIDWPTTFPQGLGDPRLEHPALPHADGRLADALGAPAERAPRAGTRTTTA
jgi:hypothetical protein